MFLLCFSQVESYSPSSDQWTLCPSLKEKKGSLAGATLDGKIFAIGGGNGVECLSDVEMLDLIVGRWINTRSMLQKVNVVLDLLLVNVKESGFDIFQSEKTDHLVPLLREVISIYLKDILQVGNNN